MRKRLPVLLLLAAFLVTFAGVAIYFSAGGTIWTKVDDNLSHHGPVFQVEGPSNYDVRLFFQLTPEITVWARNSELEIRGKYYRSWTDGDVWPAFTRKELLDRLLIEANKNLPADFTAEIHPDFFDVLDTFDEAAMKTENLDHQTRARRKLSHMLGN